MVRRTSTEVKFKNMSWNWIKFMINDSNHHQVNSKVEYHIFEIGMGYTIRTIFRRKFGFFFLKKDWWTIMTGKKKSNGNSSNVNAFFYSNCGHIDIATRDARKGRFMEGHQTGAPLICNHWDWKKKKKWGIPFSSKSFFFFFRDNFILKSYFFFFLKSWWQKLYCSKKICNFLVVGYLRSWDAKRHL